MDVLGLRNVLVLGNEREHDHERAPAPRSDDQSFAALSAAFLPISLPSPSCAAFV